MQDIKLIILKLTLDLEMKFYNLESEISKLQTEFNNFNKTEYISLYQYESTINELNRRIDEIEYECKH